MAKQRQKTPIKFVEDTQNSKLVDKRDYHAATTYSQVGPTCPRSCWFHPNSYHKAKWPKGWRHCFASIGRAAFSTREEAFEGATYDDAGLAIVRHRIDAALYSHRIGDEIIDLFRWHTGGDILHPATQELWVEHVDLIVWAAEQMRELGIPLIGYTAAWHYAGAERLKPYFLASVQDREAATEALAAGWHLAYGVLRDRLEEETEWLRAQGEKVIFCAEQSKKARSCADCGWCAFVDPLKIHMHKYSTYMLYRKKFGIELPGSTMFVVH
jgi:hypothetical protein